MKKPIFKRWWFWLLVVLVVLMGVGGMSQDDAPDRSAPEAVEATAEPTPSPTPEPTDVPDPTDTPAPTPEPEHDYVLNTNTGVFHYEGCQYERSMSEKNKQYVTATHSYMIAQGYDPCDKCNP